MIVSFAMKKLFIHFNFIVHVWVYYLRVCVHACTAHRCLVPTMARQVVETPGTGVRCYEIACGGCKSNCGHLEESSLQTLKTL